MRFCKQNGLEFEDERNILACCANATELKKSAENLLFGRGLILGFLTELNRIGWPAERAKQMLRILVSLCWRAVRIAVTVATLYLLLILST